MARAKAQRHVEDVGGLVRGSVSRHTDFLVVGEDGWPLEEGDISRKLQAGQRLREHGLSLQIMTERQWLDLLGLESKYPLEERLFTGKTCCKLLKISSEQLRSWRKLGLIEPARVIHREDLYNFQDLKALRTLNDLVAKGVRPSRIRDLLQSLAGVLGSMEKPLTQLSVLLKQGEMVIRTDGEQVSAGGQLWLRFEEFDASEEAAKVLPFRGARSAWELYWEAESLLHQPDPPEAREHGLAALKLAIELEPDFADVYCLMGNVQFAEGRLEEARLSYEKALQIEPTYAEAWHHLGTIFDRYSNWLGAVRSYEKAVECDPEFDSAHFNLALLYEEAGDLELARRHWESYLETATDPEWLEIAREHLGEETSR